MEKALDLQMQVRQNNNEYIEFLKDLNRWEDQVKNEDKNLKTERRIEEKLPPIRKKVKRPTEAQKGTIKKETKEIKKPISSYDYDAWSKFDVDAECEKVDSHDESDETETEDEEEEERIREERNAQHANMEKEKGNQLFKEGKYEAAINRYTKAIGLQSNNPILYANRGMALIKVDRYGAAEEDCTIALKFDPKYTKALARRGTARKKMKRYQQALDDFDRLINIEPKNKQAIAEITDIKKILTKQKDIVVNSNSENVDQRPPQNTKKNKDHISKETNNISSQTQKRRSNKPLKRIHIEDIGLDEENINVVEKNKSSNVNVNVDVKEIVLPKIDRPLVEPATSTAFETEFKRLKNDNEKLYKYIKMIPVDRYTKLFLCIDILLGSFIKILSMFYIKDNLKVHEELLSVSKVERFDMAIMFLSKDDKKHIQDLFVYMSTNEYGLDENTLALLKKTFRVTI